MQLRSNSGAAAWAAALTILPLGCSSQDADSPPEPVPADAGRPDVAAIQFTEQRRQTVAEAMGHLAFPDVTRLASGELLLVYRQGASHVDGSGRIMKQIADGDGATWSAPAELLDTPGIDDRDPSVLTLSSGEVLLSYFQYRQETHGSDTLILHQIFTARSADSGQSFSPAEQLSAGPMTGDAARIDADGLWVGGDDQPIIVTACSSPAVELADRIALASYGGPTLNLQNLATAPRSAIELWTRTDGGSGFTAAPVAPEPAAEIWLQEPSLLQLHDGELLMHVRTATGVSPSSPGPMAQSRSDDGAHWSAWQDFPFVGHAPYLLQLDNGVVLSAFREINDGFTQEWVSFVYSLDGGTSWSEPTRIADCGAAECGYPSLLELDGDRLLAVFYSAGGASIEAVTYDFTAELVEP